MAATEQQSDSVVHTVDQLRLIDADNLAVPVFSLSFISNFVKPDATSQLHQYLAANNLLPRSSRRVGKNHTTKTTTHRVWSDILMAADEPLLTLLGQLDISAAFDCVDHPMLDHLWSDVVLCCSILTECGRFWPTGRSRLPTIVICCRSAMIRTGPMFESSLHS